MLTSFKNKKISAVYSVLPTHEVDFMDEAANYSFSEVQMKKLKRVMGFGTRRVALEGETVGDYAIYGIKQMLQDGVFTESEIGAIIVTTTSPDHFIPPISNIVQGKFDFDEDVYGEKIMVEFIRHERTEVKFNGVEELKAQIEKDCIGARAYHRQHDVR